MVWIQDMITSSVSPVFSITNNSWAIMMKCSYVPSRGSVTLVTANHLTRAPLSGISIMASKVRTKWPRSSKLRLLPFNRVCNIALYIHFSSEQVHHVSGLSANEWEFYVLIWNWNGVHKGLPAACREEGGGGDPKGLQSTSFSHWRTWQAAMWYLFIRGV